jgi:hypothetical protein
LTIQEFTFVAPIANSTTVSATGDIASALVPSDYAIYVTEAFFWLFPAATNNGSNYWTVALQSRDSAGSSSDVAVTDTSTLSAGTRYVKKVSVNSALSSSVLAIVFTTKTKTGTPGNLTVITSMARYRLIIP